MLMPHWDYFRTVESDLETSLRYVECHPRNGKTFSLEFARIIRAACAEIDTVSKQLCKTITPQDSSPPKKLPQYARTILGKYPSFASIGITIPRHGKCFHPWRKWSQHYCPRWWQAYNKIKHTRIEDFHYASLTNAIGATAGLMAMVLYFYRETNNGVQVEIPDSYGPRLLDIQRKRQSSEWGDSSVSWGYHLP